ncbi:MAG: hypothetical protein J5I98_25470 [Phaeodactylibacter sp.]|nr:hypothetical protein [Phaeodactylibacter sp.]
MAIRSIFIPLFFLYLSPVIGQSNRVYFSGTRPDGNVSNRTPFEGFSEQKHTVEITTAYAIELTEVIPRERKAAVLDHQAVNNILKAYTSKDQLKLKRAIRDHIPALSDFQAIFVEGKFEAFYNEYFRLYQEEFPKFLNKISELDLDKTAVYHITLEDFVSEKFRNAFRKPYPEMMRADLSLKQDKFGIISNTPFIHLFFIRLESGLRIFHFQALENPKP